VCAVRCLHRTMLLYMPVAGVLNARFTQYCCIDQRIRRCRTPQLPRAKHTLSRRLILSMSLLVVAAEEIFQGRIRVIEPPVLVEGVVRWLLCRLLRWELCWWLTSAAAVRILSLPKQIVRIRRIAIRANARARTSASASLLLVVVVVDDGLPGALLRPLGRRWRCAILVFVVLHARRRSSPRVRLCGVSAAHRSVLSYIRYQY